jgi:class 3 adenylate cyclase
LSSATPIAKEVLECGVTISASYDPINAKMHKEGLPPVNYRTSVDYGQVKIDNSKSSQNDDLVGSSMNICSKINGKAAPNGMIIGEGLFKMLGNAFDGEYAIQPAGEGLS